jgi:hypothetical protein
MSLSAVTQPSDTDSRICIPFSLVAVVASPITPLLLKSRVVHAKGSLPSGESKLPSGCSGGYSVTARSIFTCSGKSAKIILVSS